MKKPHRYGANARRVRITGDWCVYCGDTADSEDHFPPASVTSVGWLIPCCRECNSVIGQREPFDLKKRREIVAKRYGRVLSRMRAEWKNSEIDEQLGGNLQRSVRQYQNKRRQYVMRVKWSVEAYLAAVAPEEARKILGQGEQEAENEAA